MDVPYISVFSCGHISYHDTPGSLLKVEGANWVSLEKVTSQDDGTKSIITTTLSTALCHKCRPFGSTPTCPIREAFRPHNLKVIVTLLQDSLSVLGDDDKNTEQVQKAHEAVKLLIGLADSYPWAPAMKPCQKEMRQFIVFAITLVNMAVHQAESTDAEQPKKLVYIDGMAFDLNALGAGAEAPEFSAGTIDRQLRGIVPSGKTAPMLKVDKLSKVVACLNIPENDQSVPQGAVTLIKAQKTVPKIATVLAKQYLSASSVQIDVQSLDFKDEDTDADDYSVSFGSTASSPASSQNSPQQSSQPTSQTTVPQPTSTLTDENRLVSYFQEWRDSWDCDFCGPLCFCGYVPE